MRAKIFFVERGLGILMAGILLFAGCNRLAIRGGGGDTGLEKALGDIIKSYSIEDITAKDALLADVQKSLKSYEQDCEKKHQCPAQMFSVLALYYMAAGNAMEAKKYNARAMEMNPSDPWVYALSARILLKEQGRVRSEEALGLLKKARELKPGLSYTDLGFGDCHFLKGNYTEARRYYTLVLRSDTGFQVDASDRMETIYQIESLGINPGEMQDVIFSRGIQRDDVADLLDRVFQVERMVVLRNPLKSDYKDINDSLLAPSIKKLLSLGIYSYMAGDTFAPFTVVRKRELAKIIEDCMVAATGNSGFRSKYGKNDKSPFTDVNNEDPWFNAIMLADEYKLMDSSLGGAFEPLQPVKGLDAIIIFKKMTQRFRR